MKNIVNSYVRKFREDRRKSRRAVAMLLALALVVSTGVTWQLHSTGIAMTNETYCGLEEHTHSEDCYEKVLVCGKEESEGHTHSEDCYDEEGNLTCGKEESAGHTHSESCYEEQLTCGKEEHTHTVTCLTDITADVETASDWKKTLPKLTGDWAADVAAIATSQIGYTESTANFTLDEDGKTRKGYTRYGEWYGNEYGDWDAMFASFCLYYAGVDEDVFPEASGAYAWTAALNKLDLYEDSDYTPAVGDLVFFDTDKNGKADHVGVVTAVTETTLTAIEGDSSDKVEKNTYKLSDSTIIGYGALPEQTTSAAKGTETYTAADGDVTVTVTAPEGALRSGAELSVTLFDEDSEEYAAAGETVAYDAADEDTGMAAMDISFTVNGVEVEPTEAVTVSIDASALLPEDANAESIEVQHLTETSAGVEATLVANATEGVDTETATVEFEVESFSSFTITWSGSGGGPNGNSSKSITATAYDSSTNEVIDGASGTISASSGNAVNLTSSNSSLKITGYELTSAVLNINSASYTVTSVTVTITTTGGQGGGSSTTTYSYAWVNSDGTTGSLSSYSGTPTISLYYTAVPTVTITDVTETSTGYTLSTSVSTFTGTPTYTWTVTSGATISGNGSTATLTWDDGITDGTIVTVTVTATYTYEDSDGNTVTEEDSDTYTLIYGASQSQTVSGGELTIYFLESDGSVITGVGSVSTSLTGSEITAETLAGYYTVSASDDDLTYTFWGAYTDYSMTTEIYSIYCDSNGVWYYRTSSSGSWIELDPSTIYLVYCLGSTDQVVSKSNASSTDGYYHIDVRISGSFEVTVSSTDADKTDVKVTKNWVDDDNSGDTRPESITVYLTDEDGEKLTDSSGNYYSATLTADNNWSYTWEELDLDAGIYGVTEDSVSGYTLTDSTTFTVTDASANALDDGDTYTGTLTVTELSAVYITKTDGTIIYVSMRPGTTSDDNSSAGTNYEYQSLYGHDGYTDNDSDAYGPYNLDDGDTITVVISFTYTFYDEDGNEYTGTVENYEITTEVSSDNNACEYASSTGDMKGFDVELSAEGILQQAGIITSESASLTNTLDETTTTTTDLTIVKLEEDTDTTYLAGAEFYLYYVDGETTYYYASYDEETDTVTWTTTESEAMKITSENSEDGVTVSGLTVGTTYYLEEVTAPDGYNLLSDPIQFELEEYGLTIYLTDNEDASADVDEDGNPILYVFNSKGYELPSTGGCGTWMYTLAGLTLCGGAALLLLRKRWLA
ncbi:MAG: Cna B-type domain-containing protein [Clostridiales bacterium]|nr:Cna B-type domain-containing protein [Clostridiales bacterium]